MLLQRGHLLLVNGRLFEIQGLGRFFHQALVMPDHLPAAAAEQRGDLGDPSAVFLFGNGTDATAFAASDVVFQARTEFPPQDGLGVDFQRTGAQRIQLPEEFQEVARMHDAAVGSEIAGAVLDQPAGQEDLGILIRAHADPGIGLRVLEQDVVPGLVLLDEVVFQQQGIRLGSHDRKLGVGDLRDQDAGLAVEPLRRDEILGDPLVQVLRLAYIDDIPLGVIVAVDTGGMRK